LNCVSYPITIDIPDKHAKAAIKIVEGYLLPRSIHVAKMSMSNDLNNHHVKISKALDFHGGGATRSQLIRHTKLNKTELDRALDAMISSGSITKFKKRLEGVKKDTEYYISNIGENAPKE
jgi:ribosomal protein L31E